MVKINNNTLLSLVRCQVNLLKTNEPGIYFLFNDNNEIVYIGESRFPMIRILDHYFKHYKKNRKHKTGFQKKGIGPIFSKFRIIPCRSEDKRVRMHYEKRWIRKFDPPINFHSSAVPYDLSIKEIKQHILIFEDFFSGRTSWHRYINDEVMKKRPNYMVHKKMLRKRRYTITGR